MQFSIIRPDKVLPISQLINALTMQDKFLVQDNVSLNKNKYSMYEYVTFRIIHPLPSNYGKET